MSDEFRDSTCGILDEDRVVLKCGTHNGIGALVPWCLRSGCGVGSVSVLTYGRDSDNEVVEEEAEDLGRQNTACSIRQRASIRCSRVLNASSASETILKSSIQSNHTSRRELTMSC